MRDSSGKFKKTGKGLARKPVSFKVTQEVRDWIDTHPEVDIPHLLRGCLQAAMEGTSVEKHQIEDTMNRLLLLVQGTPQEKQLITRRVRAVLKKLNEMP